MNTSKQSRRLDLQIALTLFGVFTCLFLLTSSAYIQTVDGETAYQTTEALVERRTFALLAPEIAGDALRAVRRTDDGDYGVTGPLQSLLAIPFYLVGKWVAQTFPPLFAGYFTRVFVALTNSPIHALTAALVYLIGRELGYRRRTSLFVTLTYGLATLAWPYSRTFFADTPLTFWLTLATWAIYRYAKTEHWPWMTLAGSAIGLGIANKYVMAFALPAFGLYVLLIGWQQADWPARRHWAMRTVIAGGLPFVLILLALVTFNITRFGHPLETGYTGGDPVTVAVGSARGATPLLSLYGFFLSSGKGYFFFSPPTLLALWGVSALARRRRNETYLLLAVVLAYPLIYSFTKAAWYGGATWGPRHILCITPFLVLLIGAFLERRDIARWRRVGSAVLLFVLGFWVQMSVIFVNYSLHLFGDTQFMQQIFHPANSPLAAQWDLWPRQVKAWQAYEHDLRASGAEFYLLDEGFYDIEAPDMAPFGRWMRDHSTLRIYAQPQQALTIRVAYSRPRQADAGTTNWTGLYVTYDNKTVSGERQLITENERETQWIETFTILAGNAQVLPGTLAITATTWQPLSTGDTRELSIFIANIEVLKDDMPLSFREAHLPRPLPVSLAYQWSRQAMFWFYNPANARPFDVWAWYVWTCGVHPQKARAFIIVFTALLAGGLLMSALLLISLCRQKRV